MDKLTQQEINVITATVFSKTRNDIATVFAQKMREAVSEAQIPFVGVLIEKIDRIENDIKRGNY